MRYIAHPITSTLNLSVLLIAVFCLFATNDAASVAQSDMQEPSFTRAFMSLKISDQLSVELRAIRRKDTQDELDQFASFHVVTRHELTDTKTNEDIFEYKIARSFDGKRPSLSLTPMIERGSPIIMLEYKAGANQTVFEFALRAAVDDAHGSLESPTHEFKNDGDSMLVEHLLASVSEHQRVKNAEQVRNRQEARLRAGYYPFNPPLGYVTERMEGRGKVLVRDEPIASILQEGLEGYATGRFNSQAEVARFFNAQPEFPKNKYGEVTIETAKRILKRLAYAGMVERPAWGVSRRKGQHEGLISYEMYEKIQNKLAGKAYAPTRPDLNQDFPLRGAVVCGDCGNPLTACYSKSKTGAKHAYYMCFKKGCESYRKSIKRSEIEGRFAVLLQGLAPKMELYSLVKAMFQTAWSRQIERAKEARGLLAKQMDKAEQSINQLLDRIVETNNPRVIQTYETKIDALECEKLVIAEKLETTGKPSRPYSDLFELTLKFIANPGILWGFRQSDAPPCGP